MNEHKKYIPTLNKPDGIIATSPKGKAEALNLFFNSVFTTENLDNLTDVPSHDNGGCVPGGNCMAPLLLCMEE